MIGDKTTDTTFIAACRILLAFAVAGILFFGGLYLLVQLVKFAWTH